jgi:predicted MFS family arabinose efflux permease
VSRSRHPIYVLTVLTLVYTTGFLDQGVVNLLVQPIADQFRLSDTQIGAMTGIGFALLFATMAVPFARWSDRGNRSLIAALAMAIWAVGVLLCLEVSTFAGLMAARMIAAIGGAACMPPTYSLLGDYFPAAKQRTRAMAIYMVANPASALIGFAAAGWLNERVGWRGAFGVIGIPGVLLAALVWFTVAEPRQHDLLWQAERQSMPNLAKVLVALWKQRAARYLGMGIVLSMTAVQGLAPWFAAFMMRNHGMGTAALGVWLGGIFGVGGALGMIAGGFGASHFFPANERAQMRACAAALVLLVPVGAAFLFASSAQMALIWLVPFIAISGAIFGPCFSLLQILVDANVRATTLALVLLVSNLVGMGMGPETVGLISDALKPSLGADSLRWAMLAITLISLLGACALWRVGSVLRDSKS